MKRIDWPLRVVARLGKVPDSQIVTMLAKRGIVVTIQAVYHERKRRGVKAWLRSATFKDSRAKRRAGRAATDHTSETSPQSQS